MHGLWWRAVTPQKRSQKLLSSSHLNFEVQLDTALQEGLWRNSYKSEPLQMKLSFSVHMTVSLTFLQSRWSSSEQERIDEVENRQVALFIKPPAAQEPEKWMNIFQTSFLTILTYLYSCLVAAPQPHATVSPRPSWGSGDNTTSIPNNTHITRNFCPRWMIHRGQDMPIRGAMVSTVLETSKSNLTVFTLFRDHPFYLKLM